MADADHDLYNDLYDDLGDELDADEELLNPPDDYPAAAAPSGSAPAPASGQASNPSDSQYQQQQNQPQPPQQQQLQQQQTQQQEPQGQGYGAGPGGHAGADRIKPNDMADEGKMFIGGLNWETTDDGLKAYMAQYGEVEASTIMRDPSGRSRGFAFLTYKDPASVQRVLSQTHHLDGKQIDPKRAIPRAEHERTAKVFVGGLAPSVTSESLKIFLTQFGQVMDATVMFDRETTRSKGFAFATFADEEAVGRAMEHSGIELDGKAIEIKRAQPKGSGNLPKTFGNNQPRFGQTAMGAAAGMGGGFDPNAMAMMYQNMMKGSNMGGGMGMGGGFDPNAMAMMYQNMMKNMGGMGNAPAINPNMAMRNGMGGMGMMGGMGGMGMMGGMGGMGAMGGMGGGMGMGGMGGMGMGGMGMGGYSNQMMSRPMGSNGRPVPTAPRGPAAMRNGAGVAGAGTGMTSPIGSGAVQGQGMGGMGAQRYSTQGNARAKPY